MKKQFYYFVLVSLVFYVTEIKSQTLNLSQTDKEKVLNQEYLYAFTEATKLYLFGNYVQAVNLYKECLKIKPQSSSVHYQLSKIYLNAGNMPLAREHAKKSIKYTTDNKWYYQHLGNIYQFEEKFDSALTIYRKLVVLDPENVNVYYNIATMYEKLGNEKEALNYLNLIDKKIGVSKEVLLYRYKLYEKMNMPDEAVSQLKRAEEFEEDNYTVTGMIAEFYRNKHLKDSAEFYYSRIFPKYKSDPLVVLSYTGYLIDYGLVDSAKTLLINVMKDSTYDEQVKTSYIYNILSNENEFKKYRMVLDTITKELYKQSNDNLRVMSVFADVQIRLRHYREASIALKRIVYHDETNYPAIEQLVYTLNIIGETDSVLFYSEKALKTFNNKPLIYLFRGTALYLKKQYEEAIYVLNKGLTLSEDKRMKIEFYSLLAECYQGTEQYERAEEAFTKALSIDEKNITIKNNFAYYLSLREKDLSKAEKLSYETIKEDPSNATFLDTYAWVLFKMGKYGKSRKYIISAIKNGGESNKEILMHAAEISEELKDYNKALEYYTEAARLSESKELQNIIERIERVKGLIKQ